MCSSNNGISCEILRNDAKKLFPYIMKICSNTVFVRKGKGNIEDNFFSNESERKGFISKFFHIIPDKYFQNNNI
jgi:hypothetical protein